MGLREIRKENMKLLESNEDENTIFQNPWDTMKTVLGDKIYSCIF